MSKITHIRRKFSDINSGSKKVLELFPGLEHVIMEMGWSDTGVPVILVEPMPERRGEAVTDPGDKDDEVDRSCVEIHGNEGWLAKYERMTKANE